MARLTKAIPTQQQNPIKMGFAPVFTSLTRSVLRPMAAIAITIKNLLAFFKKPVTAAGMGNTVVTTEARTKKRTNQGNIIFRLTFVPLPSALFSSRLVRTKASTRVMGMMARSGSF